VTTKQSGESTVIERARSRRFSFRGSASERVIRQALSDSFRSKEAEPNGYAVPRRLAMTR